MGAVTPIDKIWYPDETDVDQPNVYMATHAQSIEDGIGARLRHQEVAVGLKAGLASTMTLRNTLAIVPFQVNNATANFAQGLTISGGIVTVQSKGMYLVTLSIGLGTVSGDSIVPVIYKGTTAVASTEISSDPTKYATGQCTVVINCDIGDTIYGMARNGKTGATAPTSPTDSLSYLSIAMVQAVPA